MPASRDSFVEHGGFALMNDNFLFAGLRVLLLVLGHNHQLVLHVGTLLDEHDTIVRMIASQGS